MKNTKAKADTVGNLPLIFLYIIAFTEGGCVMAIELSGAKIIAPFYGTSLYVWAAILTVTLGGLTAGYFLGGRVAYRFPRKNSLFPVLLVGALTVALMPFIPQFIMPALSDWGVRTGALFSSICFMLIPLMCMGMVSPLIIQLASKELNETGKVAGTVYAISTVGGIIMTLLTGFYLLPEWGIRFTVFLTASLLAALLLASVFITGKNKMAGIAVAMALLFLFFSSGKSSDSSVGMPKIKYDSEGMLGQVRVYDYLESSDKPMRLLLINGIPQTHVTIQHMPMSAWPYPHRLATLASVKQKGSRALLIGMGGGSVAMELKRQGFALDIVEIDHRMVDVAEKYFAFEKMGIGIFVDDGRHFIKTTSEKYALVIIDVLNGEVQPYHIFTKEAFHELKKILLPDALVLINYQGRLDGKYGLSGRSILKTLMHCGFQFQYFADGNEQAGDVIFMASLEKPDFHNINYEKLNACCRQISFAYEDLLTDKKINLDDALVFTDNKPQLEIMNVFWVEQWRKVRINDYANYLARKKIPLFN
jgi:predicted membrane-bound spermidine synthase